MIVIVTFSFGLVIYRLPLLKARNELDSWVSRGSGVSPQQLDSSVLGLFSSSCATMFPTLSEAVTGQRITVAQPFFNKWMVPIGLVLLMADRGRPAAGLAEVDASATFAIRV